MLFKSREQVFKEINKIINQQLAEIEMLKGTIILKEKEIKFYEQRGDKYFVGLEEMEKTSSKLFDLLKIYLRNQLTQQHGQAMTKTDFAELKEKLT